MVCPNENMTGPSGRPASLAHGRLPGERFFVNDLVEKGDRASSLLLRRLGLPFPLHLAHKVRQLLALCSKEVVFRAEVELVAQPLFVESMSLSWNRLVPQTILESRL